MLSVEQVLEKQYPRFSAQPNIIKKPTLAFMKRLMRETDINDFLFSNQDAIGLDFIDRVFAYFNFSYHTNAQDKTRIPTSGRVVIFANHPMGALDSLVLIKLVSERRRDIKIVSNNIVENFSALKNYALALDNNIDSTIEQALTQEQAVIIFPAEDVSRVRPTGVKDTFWRASFLKAAKKAKAPLLPVRIHAKNSLLFYSASMLFKPFGNAMLAREMFKKHSCKIAISIGEIIPTHGVDTDHLHNRTVIKRLKKHLYRLGGKKSDVFQTEKPIAAPESKATLQHELDQAKLLGETRDNNSIYLFDYKEECAVLREIGRLREIAFRKVGEGTGQSRDLDAFDQHYRHLILWDKAKQTIAGSYRLGEGKQLLNTQGETGFYTSTLYKFQPELKPYLEQGLELGRSFVNPDYWGKASLDYLWQGLGTYLAQNENIRYLIGPVSMSAHYPRSLMDELVYFYTRYYSHEKTLVKARFPYQLTDDKMRHFDTQFENKNKDDAFKFMQQNFIALGHKLPVLYKQYSALFEEGGFKTLVFSVDPDFGDCLDGLCMCDLAKIKDNKRKRYIG